jgi:hypothetical protein
VVERGYLVSADDEEGGPMSKVATIRTIAASALAGLLLAGGLALACGSDREATAVQAVDAHWGSSTDERIPGWPLHP